MSWEELSKIILPNIPFDKAKTVRQYLEELREDDPTMTENFVRDTLERAVKNEGWNKARYRGSAYFWPPESK